MVLDGPGITGYDNHRNNMLNVYDPGRLRTLKERVWKAERKPWSSTRLRRPIGAPPTETATQIDAVLMHRSVRDRFRIIHIDANDKTQPPVIADVAA